MPLSISLESVLQGSKMLERAKRGTFTDDVYVQFICNTGAGGEHDPAKPPDDRVRPSHAAFHGRIFALGDAPVPPLDYGCRCAIRYVARDGSPINEIIEASTVEEPVKPAVATAQWLDANVDEWRAVAKDVKSVGPKDMLQEAVNSSKDRDIPQPRSIAEMIIEVLRAKLL